MQLLRGIRQEEDGKDHGAIFLTARRNIHREGVSRPVEHEAGPVANEILFVEVLFIRSDASPLFKEQFFCLRLHDLHQPAHALFDELYCGLSLSHRSTPLCSRDSRLREYLDKRCWVL